MRTTLDLDEQLVNNAMKMSGMKTKTTRKQTTWIMATFVNRGLPSRVEEVILGKNP